MKNVKQYKKKNETGLFFWVHHFTCIVKGSIEGEGDDKIFDLLLNRDEWIPNTKFDNRNITGFHNYLYSLIIVWISLID